MAKPATKTRMDGTAAVDAYLDKVPEPFNAALRKLRALLRAANPEAEEAMIYGVPGLRHDGGLVCYAAFKTHCGFYPMSPALMDALGAEIAAWRTSEGTLRFTPDAPLPDALVRKIVAAWIAENAAKRKHNK